MSRCRVLRILAAMPLMASWGYLSALGFCLFKSVSHGAGGAPFPFATEIGCLYRLHSLTNLGTKASVLRGEKTIRSQRWVRVGCVISGGPCSTSQSNLPVYLGLTYCAILGYIILHVSLDRKYLYFRTTGTESTRYGGESCRGRPGISVL